MSSTTLLLRSLGVGVAALLASSATALARPAHPAPNVTRATLFAKVTPPDPPGPFSFGTNLEGAAFDTHGRLVFVNTTARPGHPKVLRLNLRTRKVASLYTDDHSAFTGLAFGPDRAMYLADLGGGKVVKLAPGGHTLTDVLTTVDGSAIAPDDLVFDRAGNLYVTDYQGDPAAPTGRIVRRAADGTATVVAGGLAEPNAIAFTPDRSGLWISEDLANRLSLVSLNAFGSGKALIHTAQYLNIGAAAYADSITVDRAGNVYEAIWNAGEVLIFSPQGTPLGRVALPPSAPWATHVAFQPGTRRGFITTAGPKGGFIYTFRGLAKAAKG